MSDKSGSCHCSSPPKAAGARRCRSSSSTAASSQTTDGNGATSGSTGTNATNFRINGGQGLGADILIDGGADATRRERHLLLRGRAGAERLPGVHGLDQQLLGRVRQLDRRRHQLHNQDGRQRLPRRSVSLPHQQRPERQHRPQSHSEPQTFRANVGCLETTRRQFDYGFRSAGLVYLPLFGEGGPSIGWSGKNKTFFFFNYGGYRTSQSETVELTVPTVRMRNGDFGELLTDPYVLQFFGGPVQIFDPVAAGAGAAHGDPRQPVGSVPWWRAHLAHRSQFRQPFPAAEPDRAERLTVFRNFRATTRRPPRRTTT